MNVIDLVQSLEMGRKSCLLTLTNSDDKCEIYFVQGQAKHAAYGPITGDEAVFKVCAGPMEISRSISTESPRWKRQR